MSTFPIPQSLQTEFAAGRLVPFIGSGVSLSVKHGLFPTWGELLRQLAQVLEVEVDPWYAKQVATHCEPPDPDFLEAAKIALIRLGKARFNKMMSEKFKISQPSDADLSLPQAIWKLNTGIVITTNYDQVLTWANPQA